MEVLGILAALAVIALIGFVGLALIGGLIENFFALLGWAILLGGLAFAASLWNSGADNLGAIVGILAVVLFFVVGNYDPDDRK